MWYCKSSMSRSPTGFQEFFTVSACRSLKSSWSWASWSSISLSMASSSCCCQSTAAAPRFFHRTVTSSTSLRNMRPTFWTLSSGLTSGRHTISIIQVVASGISCIGHMCKDRFHTLLSRPLFQTLTRHLGEEGFSIVECSIDYWFFGTQFSSEALWKHGDLLSTVLYVTMRAEYFCNFSTYAKNLHLIHILYTPCSHT